MSPTYLVFGAPAVKSRRSRSGDGMSAGSVMGGAVFSVQPQTFDVVGAHDPCGPFVIDPLAGGLSVVDLGGDPGPFVGVANTGRLPHPPRALELAKIGPTAPPDAYHSPAPPNQAPRRSQIADIHPSQVSAGFTDLQLLRGIRHPSPDARTLNPTKPGYSDRRGKRTESRVSERLPVRFDDGRDDYAVASKVDGHTRQSALNIVERSIPTKALVAALENAFSVVARRGWSDRSAARSLRSISATAKESVARGRHHP